MIEFTIPPPIHLRMRRSVRHAADWLLSKLDEALRKSRTSKSAILFGVATRPIMPGSETYAEVILPGDVRLVDLRTAPSCADCLDVLSVKIGRRELLDGAVPSFMFRSREQPRRWSETAKAEYRITLHIRNNGTKPHAFRGALVCESLYA